MKKTLTLKQYRELLNYKQIDIAHSIEISQSAYSQIENRLNYTSIENYEKIASFFKLDIDYVMTNKIPVFIYIYNKSKNFDEDDIKAEIENLLNEISDKIMLLKKSNKL